MEPKDLLAYKFHSLQERHAITPSHEGSLWGAHDVRQSVIYRPAACRLCSPPRGAETGAILGKGGEIGCKR